MRSRERFEVEEARNDDRRLDDRLNDEHGDVDDANTKSAGIYMTKSSAFVTVACFAFILTVAVLITYNFGICSNINVQSEVCDKKNVIPLTIAINSSTVGEKKDVRFEEDTSRSNRTNVRLPKTMHPISYDLKFVPFLFEGNFSFNGDARIIVNVTKNSQNITLHAIALKINEIQVYKLNNYNSSSSNGSSSLNRTQLDVSKQYAIDADQFFVIEFDIELEANATYEILIKFNGVLNDMLQGFYRSSYLANNVTR